MIDTLRIPQLMKEIPGKKFVSLQVFQLCTKQCYVVHVVQFFTVSVQFRILYSAVDYLVGVIVAIKP
jgi:hypothetical protein